MSSYSPTDPLTDPGIATAEDGHVILEGPGGMAVTMTAEAAIATGQSLIEAGERARKVIESD